MASAFGGKEHAAQARAGASADCTRIRTKLYLKCCRACRRHQGCRCRKRRLRYVTDFWAALGQAAACLYLVRWGVGRKAQWRVEKLIAGQGAAGPGRGYISALLSLIGPSVPMSVCHRPKLQPIGPQAGHRVCSRLPQKGRVKCSRRSNIERKLPSSRDFSPIHRVRPTK
jgi:hypothetical protein